MEHGVSIESTSRTKLSVSCYLEHRSRHNTACHTQTTPPPHQAQLTVLRTLTTCSSIILCVYAHVQTTLWERWGSEVGFNSLNKGVGFITCINMQNSLIRQHSSCSSALPCRTVGKVIMLFFCVFNVHTVVVVASDVCSHVDSLAGSNPSWSNVDLLFLWLLALWLQLCSLVIE